MPARESPIARLTPSPSGANHIRVAAAASAWGQRGARINSISPGVISTEMSRLELAGESGPAMKMMIENAGLQTGTLNVAEALAGQ